MELLEPLETREGDEVTLTNLNVATRLESDIFERRVCGWRLTIDAEFLIDNIYHDGLINTKPEPKL